MQGGQLREVSGCISETFGPIASRKPLVNKNDHEKLRENIFKFLNWPPGGTTAMVKSFSTLNLPNGDITKVIAPYSLYALSSLMVMVVVDLIFFSSRNKRLVLPFSHLHYFQRQLNSIFIDDVLITRERGIFSLLLQLK